MRHRLLSCVLLLLATPFASAQQPQRLVTNRAAGAELLKLPKEDDAFGFVVFGDRTGGPPEGIAVLKQAVADTNLLDPDLVLTVGDLVQGYNTTEPWMAQAREYKDCMAELRMPWFPVAGNHDIYWRGEGKPDGQHEKNYETVFGPLWYAVQHKQCWFVVLYSDEGDPKTGEKNFNKPECQRISQEQFDWLADTLKKAKGARHVFVFLHHPRWLQQYGDDWQKVHELLAANGNVSAVFGGHIHHMRFDGVRDGIEYHTVASVGAHLPMEAPDVGFLHQFHVVTVRPEGIKVAAVPVGVLIDPRTMDGATTDDVIAVHRALRAEVTAFAPMGAGPTVTADGRAEGVATLRIENVGERAIELELLPLDGPPWTFGPDHQHVIVPPGSDATTQFVVRRQAADVPFTMPRLELRCDYLAADRRIHLPNRTQTLELPPPADLASARAEHNGVLVLDGDSCLSVPNARLALPDGAFTLECWVRGDDFTDRRGLCAKTQSSEFALFCSDGRAEFLVHLDGGYVAAKADGEAMQPGAWHHVAGVFDGEEVRVYVDGALRGSRRGKGTRTRNELPLLIGADPSGRGTPTSAIEGRVDDVRLSKVARYAGASFVPPQRHAPDEDTVLLLSCDRDFGPWTPDRSPQRAHARRLGNAHCTVEKRNEVR